MAGESRQIFRNTAVLATSRIIDRATGVLVAFFIARTLGPSGLGIYVTAIAYYAIIAMAAELGSTNLIVRDIARDRTQTSRYLSHLTAMAVALSITLAAVFAAVLSQLDYSSQLKTSLFVIVAAILPGTLNTIQEAVFVAHQRVEFDTLVTAASSLVNIGATIILLKTGHGIVSVVALYVVLQYAVALTYMLIINRYIARLRWKFDFQFARRLITDLKAFTGSSVIAAVFSRAEIVMLSAFSSAAQVGFYGAAYKFVDLCYFIPQTFMINVYPVLSRSYADDRGTPQRIQDQALKYLLAISIPLSVGLAVAAEPLIQLTVGDGFDSSVTPLRILSVSVVLFCVQAVLWRVLAARGEQGAVLRVQVVSVATRLSTGAPLIAGFNAIGAAVTVTLNTVLQVALLARYVRRGGTSINLVRLAWRFALAAAAMGTIGWICLEQLGLGLWIAVPVGLVSYAIFVILFKGFNAADYALIRRVLPARLAAPRSSSGAMQT